MAITALLFDGVIEATSALPPLADAFTFEWHLCSDKEKDTSRLPGLEVS
jgi:hypothetical protein